MRKTPNLEGSQLIFNLGDSSTFCNWTESTYLCFIISGENIQYWILHGRNVITRLGLISESGLEMAYLITYKKPQRDKHLETLLRSWWLQDLLLHCGWQRTLNFWMQNAICPIKIKFKIQQPSSKWGGMDLIGESGINEKLG